VPAPDEWIQPRGVDSLAILVILLTMTTMPLADVKARLSELVGRVQTHHERVTVTVHGRPSAVLVAVEDLEALQETLSVLSDPDTLLRLVESDAELARGEVVGAEELAESMAARRRHSA
jgi:antitoxin YefM